jgi:hypothetical protein
MMNGHEKSDSVIFSHRCGLYKEALRGRSEEIYP